MLVRPEVLLDLHPTNLNNLSIDDLATITERFTRIKSEMTAQSYRFYPTPIIPNKSLFNPNSITPSTSEP